MVLTVTLNPLLEKKLYFKHLDSKSSRSYNQEYLSGGKGINVSRQLNELGISNHALTFLGGANGKKLRSILEAERISFSVVSTKSETREATLIFDEEKESLQTYFSPNAQILTSEIDQFILKLEKAIVNASIVVFAGSFPNAECERIVAQGISLCNKLDKISILDTYGSSLKNLIALGPTVVHNNVTEIRTSLDKKLGSSDEFSECLNSFYSQGVNLSFITNGENDFFASKSDFNYQISNPKIKEKDATGSGDAFLSGIIYGLEKSLIFNEFTSLASSLGALNASTWDVCKVKLEDAKKLVDKVTITEIGKKIKLINDSPTI